MVIFLESRGTTNQPKLANFVLDVRGCPKNTVQVGIRFIRAWFVRTSCRKTTNFVSILLKSKSAKVEGGPPEPSPPRWIGQCFGDRLSCFTSTRVRAVRHLKTLWHFASIFALLDWQKATQCIWLLWTVANALKIRYSSWPACETLWHVVVNPSPAGHECFRTTHVCWGSTIFQQF